MKIEPCAICGGKMVVFKVLYGEYWSMCENAPEECVSRAITEHTRYAAIKASNVEQRRIREGGK